VTDDAPAQLIDTTVSHSARVWNYWLGGTDYYPVDREAGDRVAERYPDIVLLARAARGFLARAVRYLAANLLSAVRIEICNRRPRIPDPTSWRLKWPEHCRRAMSAGRSSWLCQLLRWRTRGRFARSLRRDCSASARRRCGPGRAKAYWLSPNTPRDCCWMWKAFM
jgi:hypothetical protein